MGNYIELFHNALLLLALGVIYDTLELYKIRQQMVRETVSGLLVGLLGIMVMMNPWTFALGIFFDARWVLISLCGVFFGFIPTLIAVVMTVGFRLFQGGIGAHVGSLVIIVSATIGLSWRRFERDRNWKLSWLNLYLLGVSVQVAILACMLFMPIEVRYKILFAIALPIILIFPVVTMLFGLVLRKQRDRRTFELELNEHRNMLDRERSFLRALIDSIPDALLLTDQERHIVSTNKAFTETFGYTLDEVVGKPTSVIYASEEEFLRQGRLRYNMTAEEAAKPYIVDYRRKDGTSLSGEAIGTKVLTPDGKTLGFFGLIRDISERIKSDREKAELERQLHQAQKIESIGQLAGGVAHDFNNMLGVILGHAEMALRKAPPSSTFISDLEEIRKAANRSADLTRQLLTFARKQVIAPKVLDLNEAVGGILKMLQRLIGENIQLSWNPAAELWPVKVDPSQLDQILANLCVNSRDAISGTGTISIKTANTSWDEEAIASRPYKVVPGDYVQLCVSDDGCGMDKEAQSHIFEPFYTTKEVGGGTGLGLATVYGAVKQNHGFFTVYSEVGLGTVFNIYLPRTSQAVGAKQETAEKTLLRGIETVLLVEDDEMLLRMMTTMLEESGYTVLAAITSDLAQTLAKEHPGPIHLLISDMIMPAMNGRELSARLQPLRPEIKTLFLSGYTADIISDQGVLKEDIHFLQKPFSFEALTAKVREVLDDC
jgi:PAS domain S-box-containing protein